VVFFPLAFLPITYVINTENNWDKEAAKKIGCVKYLNIEGGQ
jgi:hypothetical protein